MTRLPSLPTALLLAVFCLIPCLLVSSCNESPQQKARRLDEQARQYLADKQYAEAIDIWNKVHALQPATPDLYLNLGTAYMADGQYGRALAAYRHQIDLTPGKSDIMLQIMKIQLLLFDLAGADSTWEQLQSLPVNPEILIMHGDLLAVRKQYEKAAEEYKKALKLSPHSRTALARLAVLLAGRQARAEAETYYRQLAALNPGSPTILLQMGNYLLLDGKPDQAAELLEKALKKEPQDQELNLKLARIYLSVRQYSRAADIFFALLEQSPSSRYYKKMLLETLLQDQQLSKVRELLDDLSPAENRDVDYLILKGKFFLNASKYLMAASQFETAIEQEPRLPMPHYLLALAHFSGGQNNLGQQSLIKCLQLNPWFTPAELTLADYYYTTREYDLALEHARRIQTREPENPRGFLIEGHILLAQKQYVKAIRFFQRAFTLAPNSLSPLYYSGTAAFLNGDHQQALQMYKRLLNKQPELADAALLFNRLVDKQHETDLPHTLQEALAAHPDNPYLYHIQGLFLLSQGKKERASAAFNQALRINPRMREPYLQLFELYRNKPDELQNILLRAVDNIKNFEEALIRLASLYTDRQEPEKAITLLQEAMADNPDAPVPANNLACLYLKFQPNNIDEALRLATLAYDHLPENAAVADTLGWIYYQKNLPTRARWLLEEALALEPEHPVILYHLGMVQLKTQQIAPALKNLLKARKNADTPRLRHTIEQVLESVKGG